jgi:hypothetical protein
MRKTRVLAAACVVVLAACSSGRTEPTEPPPQITGILRVQQTDPGSGMSALVVGIVEVDLDAGCVWLSDPAGARYPVVWPMGTIEAVDPFAIVLADGTVVWPGDRIEGGGGFVPAASATRGLAPFPEACLQTGDAAVFNARDTITVTPGVGLDDDPTLVDRFRVPEAIGLELVAVDGREVAIVDFVTGTVHRYQPDTYPAPDDAIDGASGGGGFLALWAQGVISLYDGSRFAPPLRFEPDPLRKVAGVASSLTVVWAPDAEHAWLVQPGTGGEPTLLESVDLVEMNVNRLGSYQRRGAWHPVGTTTEGLVLVSRDGDTPATVLIGPEGDVAAEIPGTALSVGWGGAAILQPDGTLVVTDAGLSQLQPVDPPGEGVWVPVGGPVVPSDSPPVVTGTNRFLVGWSAGPDPSLGGDLVMVDEFGAATTLGGLSSGAHVASWSRGEDWVVVVEGSAVTLIPLDGSDPVPLGDLVPEGFAVLTIG